MKYTVKSAAKITGVIFICVLLIVKADVVAQGVKNSINLCIFTVVPSLLLFMSVSIYTLESGILSDFGRRINKLSELLFKLPGEGAVIFLMSMLGGFPIGAKLTASAVKKGILTKRQGCRMMCFCICAGPAFVINAVGVGMFNSLRIGAVLFTSLVLSSLICGVVSRLFNKDELDTKCDSLFETNEAPLAKSVKGAVESLIQICGWILVFGAVISIVSNMPIPKSAKLWLCMLLEVTRGCEIASDGLPLCISCFVLSWSGFAVHAQIVPFMNSVGLKYTAFASIRAVTAALACFISHILFKLFPCQVSAFSNLREAVPEVFSVSAPACAAMLLLFSLIILDLAPDEKM